jgi:hypothetical protein
LRIFWRDAGEKRENFHKFWRRSCLLEWLYCVQCNKFIALCSAMSGLPSRHKIVCAVVALLSAIRSFHIPKKSPPRPLSSAALVRTQNLAPELFHCPPPLKPVSVVVYPHQRRQPPPTNRRRHCFLCNMPQNAFRNPADHLQFVQGNNIPEAVRNMAHIKIDIPPSPQGKSSGAYQTSSILCQVIVTDRKSFPTHLR